MNGLRALLPVAVLGLTACADFKNLIALQRGLMAEFPNTAIHVNLTNDHLSVVLEDSTTSNLPATERAPFARRVAEFVRNHYASYDKLATSTRTETPYSFSHAELGPALAPATTR